MSFLATSSKLITFYKLSGCVREKRKGNPIAKLEGEIISEFTKFELFYQFSQR